MEEQNLSGVLSQKMNLFIVLFCALFIHSSDGNYAALYEYQKNNQNQQTIVLDMALPIELDSPVNYYGQSYSTLQVFKDGTVSFGDQQVQFSPNPQWPKGFTELTSVADRPFVAPLHHNGYLSHEDPHGYPGRIYYTKYKHQQVVTEIMDREKERFLDYLSEYLVRASVFWIPNFKVDQYVMVTWENVTEQSTAPRNCTPQRGNCPSATFQLVIASSSRHTYLIFNYATMNIPYHNALLAGMNGGKGRGWTDVIQCDATCHKNKQQRVLLEEIALKQGSSLKDTYLQTVQQGDSRVSQGNVLGRFIFYASIDIIFRGGCLSADQKTGPMDTVWMWPLTVDMQGGQIIQVSGRCQEPFSTVYCRFDERNDLVTSGTYNGMTGSCWVPRLTKKGPVKLEVSNDTKIWPVYTYITVLPPEHAGSITDDPNMQAWFQIQPNQLSVKWDPQKLQTTGDSGSDTVDIVLMEYREDAGNVQWTELVMLDQNLPNNGLFTFQPQSNVRYTCQKDCADKKLGIVEIRLTQNLIAGAVKQRFVTVGPLPLGWYVNRQNTIDIGEDWTKRQCTQWAEAAKASSQWLDELPPCPCNLQQALADWGRWQADFSCSLFRPESKCTFNKKAKHCVYSVHPTDRGAGSHCCYDNEDNLMYSGDSYEGSVSNRAHAWGAAPYGKPGTVPAMSHWLHDLIPYYQCCPWTNNEYCDFYTNNRPTRDCRFFEPPGSAIVYGDPHITTFDNQSYHFGGAGDFWLVQSTPLQLQARFIERPAVNTTVTMSQNMLLPTHITSVAMRGTGQTSTTVVFRVAPADDVTKHRLDVTINGRHLFLDAFMPHWQDFAGLSIINNEHYADATAHYDQHHSNFTVLLKGGAGVQVAERNGLLNVLVQLPPFRAEDGSSQSRDPASQPESRGLLGTWDGNRANEYTSKNGNSVSSRQGVIDEAELYDHFAKSWAVSNDLEEQLFKFPHLVSNKPPRFGSVLDYTDPNRRPSESQVNSVCGSGSGQGSLSPCAKDYYLTGNATIAEDTLRATRAFDSLRRSQDKVWSCGWLPIPFAIKDRNDYRAGRTVKVTGCRAGLGSTGSVYGGPIEYTCVQNQSLQQPFWDPYDNINFRLCTEEYEGADLGLIIGVVVAVVVVVVVAIVIAVILVRRRKSKSSKESQKLPVSAREEVIRDPGTDETLLKSSSEGGNTYKLQPVKRERSAQV